MERKTKIIIIASSVLVLGGIAYWLLKKKKDNGGSGGTLFGGGAKATLNMGYLQNGYIHIEGRDRATGTPYLSQGAEVTIEGTNFDGDYIVDKVWTDSNGNIGAFTTQSLSVEKNAKQDRTYQNEAKIIVK